MQQHRADTSADQGTPNIPKPEDPDPNLERIRYIEYAGKRVLLVDASGCTADQLLEYTRLVPQHVTKQPDHSVLLLGDFTGAQFTKETIERLKVATVFDRPHIAKSAWVLSENLHKVLLESIRTFSAREIAVFSTREEALDYLVS